MITLDVLLKLDSKQNKLNVWKIEMLKVEFFVNRNVKSGSFNRNVKLKVLMRKAKCIEMIFVISAI
jgi:hypothetical protein